MVRSFRILYVDGDPFMRDVVELSLGLDPAFLLLSCAGAQEALAAAPDWEPDLILCNAMMPGLDGPALLARLRANPATAEFPVLVMSPRAQHRDIDAMKSHRAVAVIAKPFDLAKLAETVRRHLPSIRPNAAGYDFSQRLRRDAATLASFRLRLGDVALSKELQTFAHKLAGAAGVFNVRAVSAAAAALEEAIIDARAGRGPPGHIADHLDALLEFIERATLGELEPDRRHQHAGHTQGAPSDAQDSHCR